MPINLFTIQINIFKIAIINQLKQDQLNKVNMKEEAQDEKQAQLADSKQQAFKQGLTAWDNLQFVESMFDKYSTRQIVVEKQTNNTTQNQIDFSSARLELMRSHENIRKSNNFQILENQKEKLVMPRKDSFDIVETVMLTIQDQSLILKHVQYVDRKLEMQILDSCAEVEGILMRWSSMNVNIDKASTSVLMPLTKTKLRVMVGEHVLLESKRYDLFSPTITDYLDLTCSFWQRIQEPNLNVEIMIQRCVPTSTERANIIRVHWRREIDGFKFYKHSQDQSVNGSLTLRHQVKDSSDEISKLSDAEIDSLLHESRKKVIQTFLALLPDCPQPLKDIYEEVAQQQLFGINSQAPEQVERTKRLILLQEMIQTRSNEFEQIRVDDSCSKEKLKYATEKTRRPQIKAYIEKCQSTLQRMRAMFDAPQNGVNPFRLRDKGQSIVISKLVIDFLPEQGAIKMLGMKEVQYQDAYPQFAQMQHDSENQLIQIDSHNSRSSVAIPSPTSQLQVAHLNSAKKQPQSLAHLQNNKINRTQRLLQLKDEKRSSVVIFPAEALLPSLCSQPRSKSADNKKEKRVNRNSELRKKLKRKLRRDDPQEMFVVKKQGRADKRNLMEANSDETAVFDINLGLQQFRCGGASKTLDVSVAEKISRKKAVVVPKLDLTNLPSFKKSDTHTERNNGIQEDEKIEQNPEDMKSQPQTSRLTSSRQLLESIKSSGNSVRIKFLKSKKKSDVAAAKKTSSKPQQAPPMIKQSKTQLLEELEDKNQMVDTPVFLYGSIIEQPNRNSLKPSYKDSTPVFTTQVKDAMPDTSFQSHDLSQAQEKTFEDENQIINVKEETARKCTEILSRQSSRILDQARSNMKQVVKLKNDDQNPQNAAGQVTDLILKQQIFFEQNLQKIQSDVAKVMEMQQLATQDQEVDQGKKLELERVRMEEQKKILESFKNDMMSTFKTMMLEHLATMQSPKPEPHFPQKSQSSFQSYQFLRKEATGSNNTPQQRDNTIAQKNQQLPKIEIPKAAAQSSAGGSLRILPSGRNSVQLVPPYAYNISQQSIYSSSVMIPRQSSQATNQPQNMTGLETQRSVLTFQDTQNKNQAVEGGGSQRRLSSAFIENEAVALIGSQASKMQVLKLRAESFRRRPSIASLMKRNSSRRGSCASAMSVASSRSGASRSAKPPMAIAGNPAPTKENTRKALAISRGNELFLKQSTDQPTKKSRPQVLQVKCQDLVTSVTLNQVADDRSASQSSSTVSLAKEGVKARPENRGQNVQVIHEQSQVTSPAQKFRGGIKYPSQFATNQRYPITGSKSSESLESALSPLKVETPPIVVVDISGNKVIQCLEEQKIAETPQETINHDRHPSGTNLTSRRLSAARSESSKGSLRGSKINPLVEDKEPQRTSSRQLQREGSERSVGEKGTSSRPPDIADDSARRSKIANQIKKLQQIHQPPNATKTEQSSSQSCSLSMVSSQKIAALKKKKSDLMAQKALQDPPASPSGSANQKQMQVFDQLTKKMREKKQQDSSRLKKQQESLLKQEDQTQTSQIELHQEQNLEPEQQKIENKSEPSAISHDEYRAVNQSCMTLKSFLTQVNQRNTSFASIKAISQAASQTSSRRHSIQKLPLHSRPNNIPKNPAAPSSQFLKSEIHELTSDDYALSQSEYYAGAKQHKENKKIDDFIKKKALKRQMTRGFSQGQILGSNAQSQTTDPLVIHVPRRIATDLRKNISEISGKPLLGPNKQRRRQSLTRNSSFKLMKAHPTISPEMMQIEEKSLQNCPQAKSARNIYKTLGVVPNDGQDLMDEEMTQLLRKHTTKQQIKEMLADLSQKSKSSNQSEKKSPQVGAQQPAAGSGSASHELTSSASQDGEQQNLAIPPYQASKNIQQRVEESDLVVMNPSFVVPTPVHSIEDEISNLRLDPNMKLELVKKLQIGYEGSHLKSTMISSTLQTPSIVLKDFRSSVDTHFKAVAVVQEVELDQPIEVVQPPVKPFDFPQEREILNQDQREYLEAIMIQHEQNLAQQEKEENEEEAEEENFDQVDHLPTISPTIRQIQLKMYQINNYNSSSNNHKQLDDSDSFYNADQSRQEEKRPVDDRSRNRFQTRETSLVYTFKDFMSSQSSDQESEPCDSTGA